MSDVTAALQGLRDGTVTTDDAVTQFSSRQWPVRLAHQPAVTQGDDLAADVADGSFGEVQAAYAAGWIDDEQFARLAQAAASSITGAPAADSDTDEGTDRDGDGDGDTDNDAWTGDGHPAAGQDDLFDVTHTKGLPPVDAGSFMKTPDGGRGRIVSVTDGTATVTVWAKGDSGWAATGKKITVPVGKLTRVPPPMPRAGAGESKAAEQAVYQRGVQAWPGSEKTALSPHDWASARVGAFQVKQAGGEVPGYSRDDDLLRH
jgi:hypothetical protein